MIKNLENKNSLVIILYFFSYILLLVGFYYGENASGGAERDFFLLQDHLIKNGFNLGVKNFLFKFYPEGMLLHSPVYYVLIYYLQNIFHPDFVRLIILHLYLLVPIFFLKSINLKLKNKNYLIFFIPLIFFILPSFRSISIWAGRESLTLIFLSISIFYYVNFINKKKIKYIYLSFFCLSLSSYISPEIGILSILYFYEYFKLFRWNGFFKLLLFCFFLAIPFLYYYFYFLINREINFHFHIHFLTNYPLFICSLLLYMLPFIFFKGLKNYFNFLKKNIFLILLILSIFYFLLNFNYVYDHKFGGGVIFKFLSIFNLNHFLFIFCSWGIINFIYLFKKNILFNSLVLLIFSIQTCLNMHFFQKYIDLYWIFYFIFFFKNEKILNYFKNKIFSYLVILFYVSYYLGSFFYHH